MINSSMHNLCVCMCVLCVHPLVFIRASDTHCRGVQGRGEGVENPSSLHSLPAKSLSSACIWLVASTERERRGGRSLSMWEDRHIEERKQRREEKTWRGGERRDLLHFCAPLRGSSTSTCSSSQLWWIFSSSLLQERTQECEDEEMTGVCVRECVLAVNRIAPGRCRAPNKQPLVFRRSPGGSLNVGSLSSLLLGLSLRLLVFLDSPVCLSSLRHTAVVFLPTSAPRLGRFGTLIQPEGGEPAPYPLLFPPLTQWGPIVIIKFCCESSMNNGGSSGLAL